MQRPQNTALALVTELDPRETPTVRPGSNCASETRLRVAEGRATSRFLEEELRMAEARSRPPSLRYPLASGAILGVGAFARRESDPAPLRAEVEEEELDNAIAKTTRPVPMPGAIPIVLVTLGELKDSGGLSRSALYLLLCLDGAPSLEWAIDASALCPADAYAALHELLDEELVRLS